MDFDYTAPIIHRKRVPFWVKHPRVYPWRNEDGTALRPGRIVKGAVINNVEVLRVHKEPSTFYDTTQPAGKVNRFRHLTGEVECRCLLCGTKFTAAYNRLHPNNEKRSLWSCGCERRRPGTGHRAVVKEKRTRLVDLTGLIYGHLEPIHWLNYTGWLCLCHKCGNTEGCLVPRSRLLTTGTVTACRDCHPHQWTAGSRAARPVKAAGQWEGSGGVMAEPVPVEAPTAGAEESRDRQEGSEGDDELLPFQPVNVIFDDERALSLMKHWEAEARKPRGQGKLVE